MQTTKSKSLGSASFTFGDSQTKRNQHVPFHGMQNEGVENLEDDDIYEVEEDLISMKQAMDDCALPSIEVDSLKANLGAEKVSRASYNFHKGLLIAKGCS